MVEILLQAARFLLLVGYYWVPITAAETMGNSSLSNTVKLFFVSCYGVCTMAVAVYPVKFSILVPLSEAASEIIANSVLGN